MSKESSPHPQPLSQYWERGAMWLLQSDIRHQVGQATGGINQGYDWQERAYPFVYSEITGYGVSCFVNAYRWFEDERYLLAASQAARFLMAWQNKRDDPRVRGAIPHGLSLPSFQVREQYYSFDVAMCLQGLLDLHELRASDELLEASQAMGDWLIEQMQEPRGAFRALYDAEGGEGVHLGEQFFDDYGVLHAKHAIGLLKLAAATRKVCYQEAAKRVCDWVLTLQEKDGAFRSNERVNEVVTHPHCYALEGLLYAYHVLHDARYLDAAQKGAIWLLKQQNRDGSLNIAYKRRWWQMGRRITELVMPKRVTDATAQAIRIWLILHQIAPDSRYLLAAQRAGTFLRQMQCKDTSDPNALGGFFFWRQHPIMFTWATQFAFHALYALEVAERGEKEQSLIETLF